MVRGTALALLLAASCAAPGASVRPAAEGTRFAWRGQAEEVWLTGTMSAWHPVPLARDGEGWAVVLPLPPGRYEYRLEVRDASGVRVVLPPGSERVDDGFGGQNAILRVGAVTSTGTGRREGVEP